MMKVYLTLLIAVFTLIVSGCTTTEQPSQEPETSEASGPLVHNEITIAEIHEAFQSEEYTAADLTQFYLDRIDDLNQQGPELRAVLTVNPDAMDIARELDEEMKKGEMRGPLHGIPILLKDNVDTHDKMPCTAGSVLMKESYPLQDSPIAAQLREAGAIILGKANLSEWANFHSTVSSSGWSALGGQTLNPYDITRSPCGSSAGSGVAVAANLSVLAIGTETNGSIVCPSNANGIVGIKPTVGLVSRTGVIPISFSQDTGGPMARTVTDAAICLGTLTAIDSADSKTLNPQRVAYENYTQFLKNGTIEGKRLGYFKSSLDRQPELKPVMEATIQWFRDNGAQIIELDQVVGQGAGGHSYTVLRYEFKAGLNDYFESLGSNAPIKNFDDLIEKTFANDKEMAFDHERMKECQELGDLETEEYKTALKEMHRLTRDEGIDEVMNENKLDAILSPTGSPAWKIDHVNGDNGNVFSSSAAAISGYPNITVPMGQLDGLPVGLSIYGRAWSEALLLEIAYNFEQGTKHRFTPQFESNPF